MKYGEKLKELREYSNDKRKISQKEIAELLNISRRTYAHYELQESTIPVKHLNALCNYFNISIDYLFDFTKTKNYLNINKEINIKEAGNRLKEFRKEQNLTQVKLANILNTTFSNIAFYEKGRNLIATPFLYTICKEYKISADYLLGKIDKKVRLK